MRTGTANLPLHGGTAPAWLFSRMTKLSREIISLMVIEFGTNEVLAKLSDPYWFQALGCVLGFDWHSSGVTTTVCGAIKEGLKGIEDEIGLFVAGGKGSVSRRTPQEIVAYADRFSLNLDPSKLVYASRMSAKVDNTAVQDGYQLYHHVFIFNKHGEWAVVQQGMNETNRWARRYHWLSTSMQDFVCEPHAAVCSDSKSRFVLNMVAEEAEESRRTSAVLASERPEKLVKEIVRIKELNLPKHHEVLITDLSPRSLEKTLLKAYERRPKNFRQLLEIEGVGPKTVRALAMIADLAYGASASTRDPAKYSFAHGGKDGHPYPVNRKLYDRSIEVVKRAVEQAKIGNTEKLDALRNLSRFYDF
ncbi:MAG: DUF763 domain-containing protein [Armatimonadetes bacterium]|nr:DUF763 domain-containing protein [Armatimonadota bacterium]